jgi:hypothetical protein
MRNMIFGISLLLCSLSALAQKNPVSWTFSANKIGGEEYELVLTADVESGWYIYSQHLDEGGPIPTSFEFEASGNVQLLGKTAESGPKRKEGLDELFGMNVIKYAGRVIFKQRAKITDASQPVRGTLEYMTCDDNQCLPPRTVVFEIPLKN